MAPVLYLADGVLLCGLPTAVDKSLPLREGYSPYPVALRYTTFPHVIPFPRPIKPEK